MPLDAAWYASSHGGMRSQWERASRSCAAKRVEPSRALTGGSTRLARLAIQLSVEGRRRVGGLRDQRVAARRLEPARAQVRGEAQRLLHAVQARALDERAARGAVRQRQPPEQRVDVEQIAQSADEVGVVHEVNDRVQHLVLRAEHVERRSLRLGPRRLNSRAVSGLMRPTGGRIVWCRSSSIAWPAAIIGGSSCDHAR